MRKIVYVILFASLICCKESTDAAQDNGLPGKWVVDQITDPNPLPPIFGTSEIYGKLPDYGSVQQTGGSLFYRAKELKATIELLESGSLKTSLVFSNFGSFKWTTNQKMDSLTLKLVNVHEDNLVAESDHGELLLYEGKFTLLSRDNAEWTLSDGRIFKLKRENAL